MKNLLFLILLFFITSCSVFKNISKKTEVDTDYTLDSIYSKTKNFETLTFRFSANYSTPEQNLSFFGSVKMIKDSLLYMKISPGLGIMIAEIFATPDTFLIYLPMQNQYFAGNDKLLLDIYGIPLNFTSVQNLLTAQFFSYPYFIDINDYELTVTDTIINYSNIVNPKSKPIPDVVHVFDVGNSYLIDRLIINDNVSHRDLEVSYDNYNSYNNIFFPGSIFLSLYYLDTMTLNFKNKKVVFNEKISVNFNIPDDAKVISN